MLSTAKNILKDQILDSSLVNDPALQNYIYNAFPNILKQRFPKQILNHQLNKDILATQLSNVLISDMGIAFVFQMMQETDASLELIVKAFVAAQEIYSTADLYLDVAGLDYIIDSDIQNKILVAGMRLIRQAVRWFLSQTNANDFDISKTIMLYQESVISIFSKLEKLLVGKDLERFLERKAELLKAGVPEDLAQRVASSWSLISCI